jgi:endonuclease/exonuclease/phosphatase family metal-dependent hydrolase
MKLITWNIQWGRGVDGRVDLNRIVDHARRLADFDVLCLQEVSSGYGAAELAANDRSDQFAVIASHLPGYTAIQGIGTDVPDREGGRRRFGNMVLSRYPVMQVFSHLLPWPADPGVLSMQRIALEATLDTPLGLIRVTTTHLEYYSAIQRHAQIERLRQLHAEAVGHARTVPDGEPSDGPFFHPRRAAAAILTGDCNFLPESEDRQRLMQPIDDITPPYRDAWECLYPGVPHAPTVGLYEKALWPGPPFTFDFVFLSEDLTPRLRDIRVDAHSDASDHQPVLLELG